MAKYKLFNMLSPETDFWLSNSLDELVKQAKNDKNMIETAIIDLDTCETLATSNKREFFNALEAGKKLIALW